MAEPSEHPPWLAPERSRRLAATLGGLALVEVLAAVSMTGYVGWSLQYALDNFVVTNVLMGAAFAVCGTIIAWHRPRNLIGWLFAADGIGHATTALGFPVAQALHDNGVSQAAQRLVATVAMYSWPWSIGLFLPLVLLLFPDGRPVSARWRPLVIAVVVTAPLFVVEIGASPAPLTKGLPSGYLTISSYDTLKPLWTLSELRFAGAMVLAVAALVLRYRRAAELQRRQLLWLLLATIVAVVCLVPFALVAGTPIVVLFAIPLIPAAVTVAIVRHRLLDIRLVVSRALTWLLLSIAVVIAYVALVAVLDLFVSARVGRSVIATVVVALLVAPVLPRLQRLVDRAMYGDRQDPARVASQVGQQLVGGSAAGLLGVVSAVRRALRLPYVALSSPAGVLAADGRPPDGPVCSVPLEYGGEVVGELTVGLRSGELQLAAADRKALHLVAAPLAVAVHSTWLSEELQASRGRIIATREEERRRLRRDLHDGLGPTLTGVALTADAAANLIDSDVARTRDLLTSLGTDARSAIGDIRRLVDDLRPPALDELGLVHALRQRAEQLSWRADGGALRVRLDAPDQVPALPAATEVAAYRIATEALNNVVRHSGASTAVLRLRCGDALEIEVLDDGAPNGAWRPGVGLQAMRERAAELGGDFEVGPTPAGGRVYAALPMVTQ